MTVELLTVLTCWPSTARPANALAYLRSRRARMARHIVWFYELPRPVRWLLTGKGRVPSLLASAVCVAPISEEQRRAWGRALVTLNGLVDVKPAGAPVPAPLVEAAEPRQASAGCPGGRRCVRPVKRPRETGEVPPQGSGLRVFGARGHRYQAHRPGRGVPPGTNSATRRCDWPARGLHHFGSSRLRAGPPGRLRVPH